MQKTIKTNENYRIEKLTDNKYLVTNMYDLNDTFSFTKGILLNKFIINYKNSKVTLGDLTKKYSNIRYLYQHISNQKIKDTSDSNLIIIYLFLKDLEKLEQQTTEIYDIAELIIKYRIDLITKKTYDNRLKQTIKKRSVSENKIKQSLHLARQLDIYNQKVISAIKEKADFENLTDLKIVQEVIKKIEE
ncbi:hypothetical protein [Vagococcus fluvialis]|uniref:hypothetical protein n=1 Tax=Vagococcus fluvialis TaxID=2738 RepID=UPI001D0A66CC|nr:hypothetical protein [Vagococcus fluvialis]UDM84087.1 hypothetical protein K5K96_15185 [Vagococcus fluvialis]